jgi:predicted DNA-binding protein
MESTMKKAINIRLEEEMLRELDQYAKELNKTRTSLVEKAIELYFDRLDEMIADKRIDELQRGESRVIPLEEVFRKAEVPSLNK